MTTPSTIHGSCHCKKITYTLTLTPSNFPLKAYRCNCTMCQKPNFTSFPTSRSNFTLLTPASKSELRDYQPRSSERHRYFCDVCGVQVFGEGSYEHEGKRFEFFNVNLNTVDQPQEGVDLKDVLVSYMNGLADRQGQDGLKEVPFSGGMV